MVKRPSSYQLPDKGKANTERCCSNLRIDPSKNGILFRQSNDRSINFLEAVRSRADLLTLSLEQNTVIKSIVIINILLEEHPIIHKPFKLSGHSMNPDRINLPGDPNLESFDAILKGLHGMGNNESLIKIKDNRETASVEHP